MAEDSDHVYATNNAKNLFIRNRDLQSVCDREKKLLEWEWKTSHMELQKSTVMFKKKAEALYKRTQDIDINPRHKRTNLALQLKLKTLGQSRVMQQAQTDAAPSRAQTSLGATNGGLAGAAASLDPDDFRSKSAADAAPLEANMSDLQVPLQHPLLKKRKADLFARPPPRKWLEMRWKAILHKHEKQQAQLEDMVEEFIQEIEEYKERFRRLCNPHLYPDDAKQVKLNRRVSLRMPVILGGPAQMKRVDEEPEQPHVVINHIATTHAVEETIKDIRNGPVTVNEAPTASRDQITKSERKPSTASNVIPKIEVTCDEEQEPDTTSSVLLPEVSNSDRCVKKKVVRRRRKSPTKLKIPKSPVRKDSTTHLPKVSAKRASLAATPTEEKYITLLQSDQSSAEEDNVSVRSKTAKKKVTYKPPAPTYPMNTKKTALSLDTEQLVQAFEEFAQGDQSLENMRKMGALASRLKVKVKKARDRSYVPFIGASKAIRAFKGLLAQNQENK